MRGRARALPFLSKHPTDRTPPPPGAVIYMDFAGPVMPSFPNGFTTYCGAICAGSVYGRVVAAHTMTKEVASATLALFMADISAKMKSSVPIKIVASSLVALAAFNCAEPACNSNHSASQFHRSCYKQFP